MGARPRFVDVLPDTLQVDPDAVAAAVGPRTAAVMAVHLFGQMADVDRLAELTRRHGLALIEDAAQAHGARFGGRRAGSVGVAAGVQLLPRQEPRRPRGRRCGRLATTPALTARIRQLANHGRAADGRHRHDVRGRNSRLDTLQAAVLSVKLRHLDAHNARTAGADGAATGSGCPPTASRWRSIRWPSRCTTSPSCRCPTAPRPPRHSTPPGSAGACTTRCRATGSRAFAEFADGPLPVTERAAERILSLPMSPTLTTPRSSGSAPCSRRSSDEHRHHRARSAAGQAADPPGEPPPTGGPPTGRSAPERPRTGSRRAPDGPEATDRPARTTRRTAPRTAPPTEPRRRHGRRPAAAAAGRLRVLRWPRPVRCWRSLARRGRGQRPGSRSPTACRRCTPRTPTSLYPLVQEQPTGFLRQDRNLSTQEVLLAEPDRARPGGRRSSAMPVEDLAGPPSTEVVEESEVIRLQFTDPSRAQARKVLVAIVARYLEVSNNPAAHRAAGVPRRPARRRAGPPGDGPGGGRRRGRARPEPGRPGRDRRPGHSARRRCGASSTRSSSPRSPDRLRRSPCSRTSSTTRSARNRCSPWGAGRSPGSSSR